MRNSILTFADRLRYLMNRDHIKNAPQLSAALYDAGIIRYPDAADDQRRKECRASATRTIDLHLSGKPIENISGEWISRYSKFFHCSTDYLFGNISMPTPDVAAVHDLTGLSEDAIKKLMKFKHNNKSHARADIVSILIEQFNAEYMIDLIGQRISNTPNVTPKDLKDMTPNQLSAYAASTTLTVDLDGRQVLVNKSTFLDSQISTAIIRDLPEIVSAYNQQHDQTPAARAADYAKFQSDLTRRLTEEYRSGRIDADDLTPQLRAAIDDYLRS